jgi:cytochrome c oxidase assembly factor CtaG
MEIVSQLSVALLLGALYAARYSRLRRRGRRPSALRAASFGLGLVVVAGAAAATPLESRFATHMLQHLLIGDVGPLLLVLGLSGPLLRPVLAVQPVRALRPLGHPLVALPLWAAALVGWHIAPLYDAALAHEGIHALQHVSFLLAGSLVWAALLEPLPGPAWFTSARKLLYVVAMWLVSMTLSQVLLWSARAFYTGYTLADQRAGGGVMLVESSLVMVGLVAWLLLRVLDESEARQRLVDAGVAPDAAARAARYGRATPVP